MDRNHFIGLTLIFAMLIVYAQFFAPKPPIQSASTREQNATVQPASASHQAQASPLSSDSLTEAQYGIFAPAVHGIDKEVVLENEVMKVTLTSRGSRIKEVVLKQYKNHQHQPLILLDEQSSVMGLQFALHGTQLNTNALSFETTAQDQNVEATGLATATFTLSVGPGQYIRHIFSLSGKSYTLNQDWEMVGLGTSLGKDPIQFVWYDHIKRTEKDIEACRNKTTINYYLASSRFDHLKESEEKKQEQLLRSPVQWVSIKQRFFTVGIIAQEAFSGGYLSTTPTSQSTTTVKEAKVCLTLPETDPTKDQKGQFTFYFGPNDYQTLKQVAEGFSKNISLGWPVVRWINQFLMLPIFSLLEQYVSSYGLIIVLLVIFIKLLLFPLSYRSYIAMAEMRVLKPTIDALKVRYGNDMQKIQLEQMNLYREMGINPLSGCIPVLLQMPILLAMFNFFPNAIALRQKAFLWASDLSTYDAILHLPFSIPAYGSHISLFTVLMTASTILYTWSNEQLTPAQGPMKIVSYMMPVTFMFVLNSFPAGLSFYYFVSNLVTFGQQSLIKRFVDEEKIKKKLEENKVKNQGKKKSSFQVRLEEAMKAGEQSKKVPKN